MRRQYSLGIVLAAIGLASCSRTDGIRSAQMDAPGASAGISRPLGCASSLRGLLLSRAAFAESVASSRSARECREKATASVAGLPTDVESCALVSMGQLREASPEVARAAQDALDEDQGPRSVPQASQAYLLIRSNAIAGVHLKCMAMLSER
jgi:hypothetical protein